MCPFPSGAPPDTQQHTPWSQRIPVCQGNEMRWRERAKRVSTANPARRWGAAPALSAGVWLEGSRGADGLAGSVRDSGRWLRPGTAEQSRLRAPASPSPRPQPPASETASQSPQTPATGRCAAWSHLYLAAAACAGGRLILPRRDWATRDTTPNWTS